MSTHEIQVVPVELQPHPNADTLSLVAVHGYTVVVKTADWQGVDRGIYIPPDYVVPDTEMFKFLGEKRRIKVIKLRGVISHGLLMPASPEMQIGDNVIDILGIKRYEPPEPTSTGGETIRGPAVYSVKYDVEPLRRYLAEWTKLVGDTDVVVTEKIHGANARFVFIPGDNNERAFITNGGTFYCGSRTEWKENTETNLWWKASRQNPSIIKFCVNNPNTILYGEVFGQVQDLKYGSDKNSVYFAAFDLLKDGIWLPYAEARKLLDACGVNYVPELYVGKVDMELFNRLALEDSSWPGAKHCREGIVVKPTVEMVHPEFGRAILKLVSDRYLSR